MKTLAMLGTMGALLAGAASAQAHLRVDPSREVCATTRYDGRCEVKPNRLIAGARAVIRKIHWKSWGGKHAVGVGTYRIFPSFGLPDDELKTKARVKMGSSRHAKAVGAIRKHLSHSATTMEIDGRERPSCSAAEASGGRAANG